MVTSNENQDERATLQLTSSNTIGNDIDINEIWSTFRLPIPIPSHKSTNNNEIGPYDGWLLVALDLLRLLHTMNEQYNNNNNTKQSNDNTYDTHKRMKSQMALACSQLNKLERMFPSLPLPQHDDNVVKFNNQILYQNLHTLLQKLQIDTDETCAKFQRWLDRHNNKANEERDLIYDMFLSPEDAYEKVSEEEEEEENMLLDEFSDDEHDVDNNDQIQYQQQQQSQLARKLPTSVATTTKRHESLDPVEFQKQQQELLEVELSDMASRLKHSTLAMNVTLQTQTKDLDDMETLAQNNLDTVTDTTKKVEDRLTRNKGWKKRLATWSLIGTVLGMWIVCFMIMRTVPKRQIRDVHFIQRAKVRLNMTKTDLHIFWERIKPRMPPDRVCESTGVCEDPIKKIEEMYADEVFDDEEELEDHDDDEEEEVHEEGECEIQSDGTQICSDGHNSMPSTARDLSAGNKRRRIEDNMANAPAIEAVEGDSNVKKKKYNSKDPMGCIEVSEEFRNLQSMLDTTVFESEAKWREQWPLPRFEEDDPELLRLKKEYEKLQLKKKKYMKEVEAAKNKARSEFWADKTIRHKARALKRALGSIEFCTESGRPYDDEVAINREAYRKVVRRQREEVQRRKWEEEEAFTKMEDMERLRKMAEAREEKQRIAAQKDRDSEEFERVENEHIKAEAEQRAREEEEQRHRQEEALLHQQEEDKLVKERDDKKADNPDCEDKEPRCGEWAKIGECDDNPDYMLINCPVSCNSCHELIEKNRIEEETKRIEETETYMERIERLAKERIAKQIEQDKLIYGIETPQERFERLRIKSQEDLAVWKANKEREKQVQYERRQKEIEYESKHKRDISFRKHVIGPGTKMANEKKQRRRAEKREQERLERIRLAEEEDKRRELQILERKRLEKEKVLTKAKIAANEAAKLASQITDSPGFVAADVRVAAGRFKNDILAHYLSSEPDMADASDIRGWRPIHEAARAGNLGGIEILVSSGCDINSRTGRTGNGGTALWWAIQRYGEDHDAVQLLRSHGAQEVGPET